VQLRVIARQTSERDQVRVGDRSSRAAKGHADVEIGVRVALSSLTGHVAIPVDSFERTEVDHDLHARIADGAGR